MKVIVHTRLTRYLPIGLLLAFLLMAALMLGVARPSQATTGISGPIVGEPVAPYVFNGSLLDLPQLESIPDLPYNEVPRPPIPGKGWPEMPGFNDPVAQRWSGPGVMPEPANSFEGLMQSEAGGWTPPDTNGDVGPNHYIQTVNIGIGIWDKDGNNLLKISYNDFFQGPNNQCDNQNRGDVIVLYDHLADRWVITDFSLPSGESWECVAVSQTGDPVNGGWYYYAFNTLNSQGSWADYPKLGVWPDAYYLHANMFDPWAGGKVWALDRAAMLNGALASTISFDLGTAYASLLPGNLEGPEPPAGTPNYFANIEFPNIVNVWEFHVDWAVPGNSSFDGPTPLTVADFGYISDIPQPPPGSLLDSLGDRAMMQLQYRIFDDHEVLLFNHTVPSGGAAGVRWYELRDPGGTPYVYQQGTYQPDGHYRWMGSIAMDGEGNIAVGYSASSTTLKPAIRYAGRLDGEILGALPQSEASLIEGTGVQTSGNRWGDYSAMTIDPVDDCTFWYTQEYYPVNGGNWHTRIGSFKFPSCGQAKGWIGGMVYDADSGAPVPDAMVVAESVSTTLTVQADIAGVFSMTLPADTYTLTASSTLPGYPEATVIPGVDVTAGQTTDQDIPLTPFPYLVEGGLAFDDNPPGGNDNGAPEPGESSILAWETISNTGVATATGVTAELIAVSPGVTVEVGTASYPDIAAGEAALNLSAYEISLAPNLVCGAQLQLEKVITTDQGSFTVPVTIVTGLPGERTAVFSDDMESGQANWTKGGANNLWAITTEHPNSPTHSWSDSPNFNYANNIDSWIRAPIFDLTDQSGIELSFWHRYDTEFGWDFAYVEYSLDGGVTWQPYVGAYTGAQLAYSQETFDLSAVDGDDNATFRFRLQSDGGVTADGWYIDDVALTYQPYSCTYPIDVPATPVQIDPPDGTITATHEITFTWEAGAGQLADGFNLELDGSLITTTETAYAATLEAGVHIWRARAYNQLGYSDYTPEWTVTVIDPPGVPELLSPADGSVTSNQAITLTWQAGTGGTPDGYLLELDGEVITTTETTYTTTLSAGLHTWRASAFNLVGSSEFSPAWDFTISDAPGVPTLLAPEEGAYLTSSMVTLSWEAGSGPAPDGYHVLLDGEVITVTGTSTSVMLAGGEHTWAVRAFIGATTSEYSPEQSFTVAYLVNLPVVMK